MGKNVNQFVMGFRPATLQDLILAVQHVKIVDHFMENIGIHVSRHGRTAGDLIKKCAGVHLRDSFRGVGQKNSGLDAVGIFDGIDRMIHLIHICVQIGFERCKIVCADLRKHLGDHLLFNDRFRRCFRCLRHRRTECTHHSGHIRGLGLNGEWIVGKGILLNLVDIFLETGGEGHDQRNADDTDRAGKGCQKSSGLLGQQIIKAERECRHHGHGRSAHIFVLWRFIGQLRNERIAVIDNLAVLHPNDSVGIFLCQFRIVGNHNHKAILRHLLQQIHDLHAGFAVKSAGGLIRQQNIRIVNQRTGDGHTLHLTAGHLIGALVKLIAQSHVLQRLLSPLLAFSGRNAGDGQSQFYVG